MGKKINAKIKRLGNFSSATMILQAGKTKNEVVVDEVVKTKDVVKALMNETKPKLELKFNPSEFRRDNLIFNTMKMEEKLASEKYYIIGFKKLKDIKGSFYLNLRDADPQIKDVLNNKNKRISEKLSKIFDITVRPYMDNERAIQLKRNDFLKRFNQLIYDMIKDLTNGFKDIREVSVVKDQSIIGNFNNFINTTDRTIFTDKCFDSEPLKKRLERAIKKKVNSKIIFLTEQILTNQFSLTSLGTKLGEIYQLFLREVNTEEMKTKYLSSKGKRGREKELEARLSHSNYYYYEVNSGQEKKTLKGQAIPELYQLVKTKGWNYVDNVIVNQYKLDRLLLKIKTLKIYSAQKIEQRDLTKAVDEIIVQIKNHYKEHVSSAVEPSLVCKYILSETHKYIKGRFRKINKNKHHENLQELVRVVFERDKIISKCINHFRNQIRTFSFYKGRNKLHFMEKGEQVYYSSKSLIKLNRKETLFKSINNVTTLVQLSLTNRMRIIDKELAVDYIGSSTNDNKLFSCLDYQNYYKWYDLTINSKGMKFAKNYLQDIITIIRNMRNNISHYNVKIDDIFKVKSEVENFDVNEEYKRLLNYYDLAFLRKLYNNNLAKGFMEKPFYPYIIEYYNNSLQDTLSYLPRPNKIISKLKLFDEVDNLQAYNYMLKIIYYGSFQKVIYNKYPLYRDKYNNQLLSNKHHQAVTGATIKAGHEDIQSKVSRHDGYYMWWQAFIQFAFSDYLKETGLMNHFQFSLDENDDSKFAAFIEYFQANKANILELKGDKKEVSTNIIAISKFLRKRDLSSLKHEFEKYAATDPHQSILQNIRIIKLLLEVDNTDPIIHEDLKISNLKGSEVLQLVKRKYDILKSDKIDKLKGFEKQVNDWILAQIDKFSDHKARVLKQDKEGKDILINIYKQGEGKKDPVLVTHGHLKEAYRIGFLDIIADYLSTTEIAKNKEKHLPAYSDLVYKASKDNVQYNEKIQKFIIDLKESKEDKIKLKAIINQDKEAALDSLNASNLYDFYKTYFEGFYITQLTNIIIGIYSRLASRYYQLERDYHYFLVGLDNKNPIKDSNEILNKKSEAAKFLSFNQNSDNKPAKEVRNECLHGNIFQNDRSLNYRNIFELVKEAYNDFEYHTALRNNHNEMISNLLNEYHIETQFNVKTKKHEMKIRNHLLGLNHKMRQKYKLNDFYLKHDYHLSIIRGFFDYNLRSIYILNEN